MSIAPVRRRDFGFQPPARRRICRAEMASPPGVLLRLLTIDIRRVHGLVVVLSVLAATLPIARDSLTPGVVLWSETSLLGARSVWIIGPTSAGYSAWVASRGTQARADIELTQPLSAPIWVRDLSLMLAGAYWPLVGYLLILAAISAHAVAGASWGGPWLDLWLASGCVLLAMSVGGFLVGRFWRSRLAPLVAAVGAFVVPSLLLQEIEPLEPLSVQSAAMWRSSHLWVASEWSVALEMGAFWLVVMAFLLTLWLALRYRTAVHSLVAGAAVIGVVLVGSAAIGAFDAATSSRVQAEGEAPTLRSNIPLQCEPVFATGICVHIAYAAFHDDFEADIIPVLSVFGGLKGVPTQIVQYNGYAAWDMPFTGVQYRNPDWDGASAYLRVVEEVFPAADGWNQYQGPGRFSAAQLAILAAINPDRSSAPSAGADPRNPPLDVLPGNVFVSSVPRELAGDGTAEAFDSMGSDHSGAAFNTEMHAAAERFASLTAEAQRAWLETNWAALRAGELTLEDLP